MNYVNRGCCNEKGNHCTWYCTDKGSFFQHFSSLSFATFLTVRKRTTRATLYIPRYIHQYPTSQNQILAMIMSRL